MTPGAMPPGPSQWQTELSGFHSLYFRFTVMLCTPFTPFFYACVCVFTISGRLAECTCL